MRTTEQPSNYNDLENMSLIDLVSNMNKEDQQVARAVEKSIPQIVSLIEALVKRMKKGGRLFYIGAGTSGRLGIVDASECPPTFGVPHDLVIGIIAGGDGAIRKAVEFAEDDPAQGWMDIMKFNPKKSDTVIGLAASGSTPYVVGAVREARDAGLLTGCITCNTGTTLATTVQYPIEVVVGPEFLTGSTRLKAGTAQKLVLNMISTAAMISMGKVQGNKMVDMQLSNHKLIDRGIKMVMDELKISQTEAKGLIKKHGSVRAVLQKGKQT